MTTAAIISATLTIITMLLNAYYAAAPKRLKEADDETDQELRKECLELDSNAVSVRIDNIMRDTQATSSDNPPVIQDDQSAGRIGGS